MEISLQAFITIMVMIPLVGIGYVSILHALSRRFQSAKHREDILFCEACNSIYTVDERNQEKTCPFCFPKV